MSLLHRIVSTLWSLDRLSNPITILLVRNMNVLDTRSTTYKKNQNAAWINNQDNIQNIRLRTATISLRLIVPGRMRKDTGGGRKSFALGKLAPCQRSRHAKGREQTLGPVSNLNACTFLLRSMHFSTNLV